jgi:TM2 domain-containing membrane protein YozV
MVAGILGILLGGFGAHWFYLGDTKRAVIMLCITLVGGLILTPITCGAGCFVPAGVGIWGLVEGIMILTGSINTDAQGRPLRD